MSILPNNYGEQQCTNAFLDHVNNKLERRFPGDQRQMMLGQYLIPSKFDHLVDSVIDELSIVFRAELPDLATWRPEITRWRMKFHDEFENIAISLQQSLSYAHKEAYPNIRRIDLHNSVDTPRN